MGVGEGMRGLTAGADGHMWFVELAGTMDGRKPDGNRVGRITMKGEMTEFPIPSQTGSQRVVHQRRHGWARDA